MKQRVFNTILIAALALNLYIGTRSYLNSAQTKTGEDVFVQMEKFTRVMEEVRRHYVDPDKVAYGDLVENALQGMITQLDPHSEYMNAKRHEDLRSDTRQQFGGIGVIISIRNDWLTVIEPMEDGPGAKAGLRSGDQIVKIEGAPTEGFTSQDAVDLLRGKPGTDVTVTIRRGEQKNQSITLTREIIKTKSVRDLNGRGEYKLLEEQFGYARINSFSERTADELEDALTSMEEAGMKALVLDLRDNPGGLLTQSARVAEKFLKRGELVVFTEGRKQREQERLVALGANPRTMPLVVLINENSASASEIVAGCLQDHKRAELVGAKSFGKGSVQTILPLRDGSAIRLTTAKYFTPTRRTIHEKGIKPDHAVDMTAEQYRDVQIKRQPGGYEDLPEEEQKRIDAAEDLQLKKALEVLRSKLADQ